MGEKRGIFRVYPPEDVLRENRGMKSSWTVKEGAVAFCREYGLREAHVYDALNPKSRRKSVKGWRFEWVTEAKDRDEARLLRVNLPSGKPWIYVLGVKRLSKDWPEFDSSSIKQHLHGKLHSINGHTIDEIEPGEVRVSAAAIRAKDGQLIIMVPPGRHSDCLAWMKREKVSVVGAEQGFVLDDGTFVTRDIAFVVAEMAGQIKKLPITPGVLFTEDVW